jgi:hypothetical protein
VYQVLTQAGLGQPGTMAAAAGGGRGQDGGHSDDEQPGPGGRGGRGNGGFGGKAATVGHFPSTSRDQFRGWGVAGGDHIQATAVDGTLAEEVAIPGTEALPERMATGVMECRATPGRIRGQHRMAPTASSRRPISLEDNRHASL